MSRAGMSTPEGLRQEMAQLHEALLRLAGLAGDSIELGTDALLDGDIVAAEQLLIRDRQLDILSEEIESRSYRLLASSSPDAEDVRAVAAYVRVTHELERIGDNMLNVAKSARRLFPQVLPPRVRGLIQRMREQAALQLRVAVQAFAERDAARAAALEDMDDVMDDLQKELFRELFAPADEQGVQVAVQVALVGRYFERVADHTVNFGNRVAFMVGAEGQTSA